ncbi:HEAT repeat domain-containing protein [Halorarum halobium]|uniref:HEAT repeat domain-containing protein n=1 Tax=Halorarum halobium TaxID=3075121 RepID=UPI0028A6F12A|nr:HEAT repeat domain-containing protein [Halobaculum sp. XH14]
MSLYTLARDNDMEELCERAKHSDSPAVRRRAALMLGDVGDMEDDRTMDVLVHLVTDDDDDKVRAAAVDALDDLGDEALERLLARTADVNPDGADWAAIRAFARALSADIPEFRMAAANALGRIGDGDAVGPLVKRLDDPDPRVRERVCHALGRIGDPRPVGKLEAKLEDDHGAVKAAAADALGTIATGKALAALVDLLEDENSSIRRVAASALGNASSAEPVPRLAAALGDEHDTVRRAAVFSIIELLANAPTKQSHQVRETVVSELKEADDGTVLGPLVEILEEASQARQRRNAVWFLGRVTSDQPPQLVIDALVETLTDDDKMTAQFAATSITELDGHSVESSLIDLLRDDEAPVEARAKAAFALGDVGGSRAREELDRITDSDVDKQVRKRAFAALSKLGGIRQ